MNFKMMNVYTKKKCRPMKIASSTIHTYPGYPQHVTKEKVWILDNGASQHRIYLHNKFICDVITNEGILILARNDSIRICNSNGHEYFRYTIKE